MRAGIQNLCKVSNIQMVATKLGNSHFAGAKEEIVERVKSMVFLCMYCDSRNPIIVSVVDFEDRSSEPYATAFFICPDCQNKFIVKIQDLGKVRD